MKKTKKPGLERAKDQKSNMEEKKHMPKMPNKPHFG
jgi:hypothetical protein